MPPTSDDQTWEQRFAHAAHQIRREITKRLANPRRRARGVLLQGGTKQEIECRVMRCFADSDVGGRVGLNGVKQLREGQDPPDFSCLDRNGAGVGMEIVELVDESEQEENAYRIAQATKHGGHPHSVLPPPGATDGLTRVCGENPVLRQFTLAEGMQLLRDWMSKKDAKIARKKQQVGNAWGYDWIGLLAFTSNWSIANGDFYRHVASAAFGPLQHIDRVFLVAEPFPITIDPGGISEGVMEVPLLGRS